VTDLQFKAQKLFNHKKIKTEIKDHIQTASGKWR